LGEEEEEEEAKICSADYNLKNFGCFLVNCSCDNVQAAISFLEDYFFVFFPKKKKKWSL